jgi:cobyrinic acid a,c-diamide synthase
MLGQGALRQVLAQGCLGSDLAVVEGMMGLFDGRGGAEGNTAEVAQVIKAPIILVLDVGKTAETAAAIVMGFKSYDPQLKLAGVLLNNVSSDAHRHKVEDAIWNNAKLPVLGALPNIPELAVPERPLGVLPAQDGGWDRIRTILAETITKHVDLDLILRIAGKAELLPLVPKKVFQGKPASADRVRLAVAYDDAFNFYYPENLELLEEYGAEIMPFSPLEDERLPSGVCGLYMGGSVSETYVEPLTRNRTMIESIQRAHRMGIPIYAECGGLMYLGASLRTEDGKAHAMAGVIPVDVQMESQLDRFGYRQLMTLEDSILSARGQFYRGHEFHRSRILSHNGGLKSAYQMLNADGELIGYEGFIAPNLLASYVHLHFGQNPVLAEKLLSHCRDFAAVHSGH